MQIASTDDVVSTKTVGENNPSNQTFKSEGVLIENESGIKNSFNSLDSLVESIDDDAGLRKEASLFIIFYI